MQNILTLRGIVLLKFATIGEFADFMGWSRTKASRIVNGVQIPSVDEAQLIAEKVEFNKIANELKIKPRDLFIQIFFPSLSTKWTA